MDPEKLKKIADGLASCASRIDEIVARRADADQPRDKKGQWSSAGHSATVEAEDASYAARAGGKAEHKAAAQAHEKASALHSKLAIDKNTYDKDRSTHESIAKAHANAAEVHKKGVLGGYREALVAHSLARKAKAASDERHAAPAPKPKVERKQRGETEYDRNPEIAEFYQNEHAERKKWGG